MDVTDSDTISLKYSFILKRIVPDILTMHQLLIVIKTAT